MWALYVAARRYAALRYWGKRPPHPRGQVDRGGLYRAPPARHARQRLHQLVSGQHVHDPLPRRHWHVQPAAVDRGSVDDDDRHQHPRRHPQHSRGPGHVAGEVDDLLVPVLPAAVHPAPDQRRRPARMPLLRIQHDQTLPRRGYRHVIHVEPSAGHGQIVEHLPASR